MCLDTISKRHEKPSKRIRKAWKAVSRYGRNKLRFPCFQHKRRSTIPQDVWLKAVVTPINIGFSPLHENQYNSGFHVFTSRKAAEEWMGYASGAVQVLVRGVHTEGLQDGEKALVADEMFLPSTAKKMAEALKSKAPKKSTPKKTATKKAKK